MVTLALLLSSSIHTAGKLLAGLEIVEQQGTVNAQGGGDFLPRLDSGIAWFDRNRNTSAVR